MFPAGASALVDTSWFTLLHFVPFVCISAILVSGFSLLCSPVQDDVEAEFEAMCAEAAESDFLAAPAVPAAAEPVLPDLPAGLPALPVPARAAAAAPARVAVAVGAPAPAARPRPAAPVDADLAALEAEFN